MLALVTIVSRFAGLIAPATAGFILAAGGTGNQLFLIASGIAAIAAFLAVVSGLRAHTSRRAARASD